ncbi:MAG: hypothetical protein HYZ25_08080 [Chloroflexi bacterium]|nr:hypothetical protein [Chloroflexota bacterium]
MDFNLLFGSSMILTVVLVVVSLLCTFVIVAASIAVPFILMRKNQKRAQELMAVGTQGEATVLALQDTGMFINNNPRVSMLLEIRVGNLAPYQVQKVATIPMIRLSQIQVGAVVPVMVDMSNPTHPDKVGLLLR